MEQDKETKKLMNWASDIDENTLRQARQTSSMPFVWPHLALMPDAHLGKGATVGSVIPTTKAIMPAAVGVDLGCGMIAVRIQFTVNDLPEDRSAVRERIEQYVPLSAGKYNTHVTRTARERISKLEKEALDCGLDPDQYAANWRYQLGTLGSGNHFIEISADENDNVWLFLHSGSRGIGNKIASHHIDVAKKLMEQYWISLPDADLAYLVEGTPEFERYMSDLQWAQRFAWENRAEMMGRVVQAVEEWTGEPVERLETINCHHNYVSREHHYGRNLLITRKGAINARAGVMGLIPGSMGTASYIVEGKGNPLSFCSAPHGAGRDHSRNEARRLFSMQQLEERMQGIEWRHTSAFIDEIPDAYKNIDQVMRDAADLVEIRHTLHQLVNVKGD